MEHHAEFKDVCQDLEIRSGEIAVELQELPLNYKLAERYNELDQEVYDLICWYDDKKLYFEQYERERKVMENKVERLGKDLKFLNNDVQTIKLQEFSHAQRGGWCSQLYQSQRP
jgi:hypothetical protein